MGAAYAAESCGRDDSFRKGIRSYYKKYFNSTASTNDFRLEMEKASGKDLAKFFDQWLYQGGNIKLQGAWRYDKKKRQVVLSLEQVQAEKYEFDMPIEIGVFIHGKFYLKLFHYKLVEGKMNMSYPSGNIQNRSLLTHIQSQ